MVSTMARQPRDRTELAQRTVLLYLKHALADTGRRHRGPVPVGEVRTHGGQVYVRVNAGGGEIRVLAVYVVNSQGGLTRRKKWPPQVAPPAGPLARLRSRARSEAE